MKNKNTSKNMHIHTQVNIGGGDEANKYILEQQHLMALTKVEREAVSSSKAKKRTYFGGL